MVRFTKKESEARKQLLESTNQMNDAKETENGKNCQEITSLCDSFNRLLSSEHVNQDFI